MVRGIQCKALGENLEQTSVRSLSVLDHSRVRLQRDVDCRDRVFLRAGRPCMGEQRSEARHKQGQHVQMPTHITWQALSTGPN